MDRIRLLNFVVVAFALLGAASAAIAVVMKFTGNEAGSAMPGSVLLVGQGVLMGGIAAVGSIASGILKVHADRIETLERRLNEAKALPADQTRP